tara:strand:+ start:3426 stop:4238 length:813 start_codon:yes stop_codon:yes gene_type:complete
MKAKFSVLIPVYIKEDPEFFQQCLDSILIQSIQPDEIIITADRGISSAMQKIINEASSVLPIKLITYLGNSQLGGSLNLGVLSCSNELIFRMDADDICVYDRFEYMLNVFNKADADLLGGWTNEFINKPNDIKRERRTPLNITLKNSWLRNPLNHPTVLFKKKSVLDSGNYQECIGCEDWYLWLRMLKNNKKLLNCDKVVVHQRVGNGFENRRSGKKYLNYKINAIKTFKAEKLITTKAFWIIYFIEHLFRLLPKFFIKFMYDNLLRKSK